MRRRSFCNRGPSRPSFRPAQANIPAFIKSAIVQPRAAMGPIETVRQMAQDMLAAESREGGISFDDLKALGFTPGQIKTHGDDARIRAQSLAGASL